MIWFMRCHILFWQMFTRFLKSMVYHSHTVSHFFMEGKKKNLASNIPKNQQCRCGRELVSLFKTCGCRQSFALEFHTAVLDLFVRGISDASSSWNISQDNIARLLQWIYLFSFVCICLHVEQRDNKIDRKLICNSLLWAAVDKCQGDWPEFSIEINV